MSNIFKVAQPVRVGNFSSAPADASAGAIYWDTSTLALYVANGTSYSQLAVSTNEFLTNVFRLDDNTDPTKKIAFNASGISTGTTRTLTMPDANVDLGNLTNSNISPTAAIAYSKLAALTANRLLVSDGSGFVSVSAVTSTEAGYLSGVTSAIQTQLNAKANDNIVIKKDGSVTYTANQPMGGFKLTGLGAGTTAGDSVRYEQVILRDGSQAFTGDQSMGSHKLTNVTDPTSAQDAATKNYVDSLTNGLSWKQAVRAATTTNGTLASSFEDGDVIDGVTLSTGDRILIKNQTASENNGIYTVNASGAPTRALDMDSWSEVPAAACFVEEGTVNADKAYVCTSDQGGTLGTTAITFVQFSSASSYVAGNGITISGQTISANLDNVTLDFTGTQIEVKAGGISNTQVNAAAGIVYTKLNLSNSIVNADINTAAAIAYSKLNLSNSIVNADINTAAAIAYSKLALTNSIVNADINASAAIAYSKLNLSASIVNADIAAGAAIAYNKLAALTANRALQSDGSGFVSVSAVTSTELGYVSGVTSAIQTQLDAKVTGPASATDNALARFDGTTGKLIQNSTSTLSDSGALSIADTFSRGDSGLTNSVEEEYIHGDTLTASTTAVLSSLTFDSRNFKSERIDYSLSNGNIRRTGSFQVVGNNAAGVASTSVSFTDQSTETGDVLVSWSAAVNGNNIELSYTTGAGTFNMNSDIKRFKS